MTPPLLSRAALHHLLTVRQRSLDTMEVPTPAHSALYELLAAMAPADRATLCAERTFVSGEIVFTEGDDGDEVFLVVSGLVAIIAGDLARPTILDYRGAGEILGEMALLENRPRSATIVALSDLTLYQLSRAVFERLLASHPTVAMSVMTTLSARLRMADHIRDIQTRAQDRLTRELDTAGEVQFSLLPEFVPDMPGWGIAAGLDPVWQTSGDFYDFIELDGGRLGILVADVADKGTGAALYMALSRTLIRTFAVQHPADPARVMGEVNERILADTRSDQFVTVFYGVLEPASGALVYANAGHNPPLLLRAQGSPAVEALANTGVPLGILDGRRWEQHRVRIQPGDALILYTDGVSEAQDTAGAEYGTERLRTVAASRLGAPAADIHFALMTDIGEFVGPAAQFDDLTLLVVVRDPA